MSSEERKMYMRNYMKARRATKRSEIKPTPLETNLPQEPTELTIHTPWIVWAVLGGISLLIVVPIALLTSRNLLKQNTTPKEEDYASE